MRGLGVRFSIWSTAFRGGTHIVAMLAGVVRKSTRGSAQGPDGPCCQMWVSRRWVLRAQLLDRRVGCAKVVRCGRGVMSWEGHA